VFRVTLTVLVTALVAAPSAAARPHQPPVPSPQQARKALSTLKVSAGSGNAGYERSLFGSGWRETGDSCNVRDRVLIRAARTVHVGANCTITGVWVSLYDGRTLRSPRQLQIDHMVPLANAWRSGARSWSRAKRIDYANDLTDPLLYAVSISTNESKGDSGPEEWKPPRKAAWCVYSRAWVTVKSRWKLTVTRSERSALRSMLGTC